MVIEPARHNTINDRFERNHAFIVGIDNYPRLTSLRTAVNDARRLAATLDEQQHFLVHPPLLDASRAELQTLLWQTLPTEVGAGDRVLFYFAGHGVAADGEDGPAGYLIPSDADPEDTASFVAMDDLQRALEALPCRHVLLVLDCCFAGAFRWSSQHRAVEAMMPKRIYQERFDRFLEDPAWQVITSSAYDQKALDVLSGTPTGERGVAQDGDGSDHSPFALALFAGLSGVADVLVGREGDGVITATELYAFVRDRVETQTIAADRSYRQTPGFFPLRKHDKGEYLFANPHHRLNLAPIPSRSPYKGLAAFEMADEHLFYGRDRVVAALRAALVGQRLLVVTGPSGTGKSSLIKAGVLPRLRAEGHGILPVLRPGEKPLAELDHVLAQLAELAATTPARLPAVLLVDQFEELITRCDDPVARATFAVRLREVIDDPRIHRVLICVRADFEAQLADGPLKDFWQSGRQVVPPFTLEELRQVVVMPTLQEVLIFEPPELVDEIIGEVVQAPGALPLLSYTLSELYERYRKSGREDRALLESDYRALGGVIGALRTKAERLYEGLQPPLQRTLRNVMLRMVSPEGNRASRRAAMTDLTYPGNESANVAMVIEQLLEARLIVKAGEPGAEYVEPAHDALVRSWKTLEDWIHALGINQLTGTEALIAFAKVNAAAHDYESPPATLSDTRAKPDPNLLWDRNPRLPWLLTALKGQHHVLNAREVEFIRRSERRRKLRVWTLRGTVAAVGLTLSLLTLFAWDRKEAAELTVENARAAAQTLQATVSRVSVALLGIEKSQLYRRGLVDVADRLNRQLGLGDSVAAGETLPEKSTRSAEFWRAIREGDAAIRDSKTRDALQHYAQAIALAGKLMKRHVNDREWMRNRSVALQRAGDVAFTEDTKRARQFYQSAIALDEQLVGEQRAGWSLRGFVDLIANRSRRPEDDDLWRLAIGLRRLGDLERSVGGLKDASMRYAEATRHHLRMTAITRTDALWRSEHSALLQQRAENLLDMYRERPGEIQQDHLDVLQQALELNHDRHKADPKDPEVLLALSYDYMRLGEYLSFDSPVDVSKVDTALRNSLGFARKRAGNARTEAQINELSELRIAIANTYNEAATRADCAKDVVGAHRLYEHAVRVATLEPRETEPRRYDYERGMYHFNAGRTAASIDDALGNFEQAKKYWLGLHESGIEENLANARAEIAHWTETAVSVPPWPPEDCPVIARK